MSSASNTFGPPGSRTAPAPASTRRPRFGRRRSLLADGDSTIADSVLADSMLNESVLAEGVLAGAAVASSLPVGSAAQRVSGPGVTTGFASAPAEGALEIRRLEQLLTPLPPLPPLPPAIRIDERNERHERHETATATARAAAGARAAGPRRPFAVEDLWLGSETPTWARELDKDPTVAATRIRLERHLAELSASVPDIVGALLATRDGLPMAATLSDSNVERISAMTASVASLSARAVESTGLGAYRETLVRCGDGCFVVYEAGSQAVLAVAARSCRNLGLIHLECRRAAQRFARLVQECGSG